MSPPMRSNLFDDVDPANENANTIGKNHFVNRAVDQVCANTRSKNHDVNRAVDLLSATTTCENQHVKRAVDLLDAFTAG